MVELLGTIKRAPRLAMLWNSFCDVMDEMHPAFQSGASVILKKVGIEQGKFRQRTWVLNKRIFS